MKRLLVMLSLTILVPSGCADPGTDTLVRVSAIVDGPSTFGAGLDVSAGDVRGVSAMDARDLDGDGLIDIAVFEGGKHAGGRDTFAWFQAPADAATGSWTRHEFARPATMRDFIGAAQLADVDDDDDDDLVVSMDYHSGGTRSAYVYWLENPRPAGDATTDVWETHVVGADLDLHHINDLTTADIDGDGNLDIVFRSLTPNEIHLVFQNSVDDWVTTVIETQIDTGEGLAVGTIDGDDRPDIAFNGVWLRSPADPRSNTWARFDLDPDFAGINANTKEDLGDLDGDGDLDIVISPAEGYRNGGNHVLAWYENPDDPTGLWPQHVIATDFNGGHTLKLGDIDGDCDLDIVSGVAWSMWGQTQHVSVYFNRDGDFSFEQEIASGRGLYSGVLRDIGSDGTLDIIGQDTYANNAPPRVYLNDDVPQADCPTTMPGEDMGAGADMSASDDTGAPANDDMGPRSEPDAGANTDPGAIPGNDNDGAPDSGEPQLSGASEGCQCSSSTGDPGVFWLLALLVFFRRRS